MTGETASAGLGSGDSAARPENRSREAFLGVERSLGGKRWRLRLADDRTALALAQRLALPEIVGRILAARGVAPETCESFLDPTLRAFLPDPHTLHDMEKAAERLARAVREGEAIAVFGDYDVDGATASALLQRFFAAAGAAPVRVYIPDRMREGYGPNAPALKKLKDAGASVAVTVDCGVTAFEPLAEAAGFGLDVVVVDHHQSEPKLPAAHAVVDPNRFDESGELGQLAAVGVAFLLAVAVNRKLRDGGWYGARLPEPDLLQWLDLVALGTVCDVVPLTGPNRALVAQGLKVMAWRGNPGLAALADVAGLDERPGTYHAGFVLGPRVNAGGRVGRAELGARLLATEDGGEAREIAFELDAFNRERQRIEAGVLEEAAAQVESREMSAAPFLMAAGEGWHPGVVGIVAGRLKDRYNRPVCVFAVGDGLAKGSGRSIPGVDLGAAVIAARQAGLLLNGGGHAMAAGLTAEADKLPALKAFLDERIGARMEEIDPSPACHLDGALSPAGVTRELVSFLGRAEPFGVGNPEPRFAFPHVRIMKAEVVGADHVRCFLAAAGGGGGGGGLKAIAFRVLETPLGQALLNSRGVAMHVAGRVRADNWRGREGVQLLIDDAAPAGRDAP